MTTLELYFLFDAKTHFLLHTLGGQKKQITRVHRIIKESRSWFVTWKAIQGDDENLLAILLAVSRISNTKAHIGQAAQHLKQDHQRWGYSTVERF